MRTKIEFGSGLLIWLVSMAGIFVSFSWAIAPYLPTAPDVSQLTGYVIFLASMAGWWIGALIMVNASHKRRANNR